MTDKGPGIRPEHREKLFTPFFSTKPGGTGLGLAISYGIVKDHGGEIRVSSAVGEGAAFVVTLPVRQEGETSGQRRNGFSSLSRAGSRDAHARSITMTGEVV